MRKHLAIHAFTEDREALGVDEARLLEFISSVFKLDLRHIQKLQLGPNPTSTQTKLERYEVRDSEVLANNTDQEGNEIFLIWWERCAKPEPSDVEAWEPSTSLTPELW